MIKSRLLSSAKLFSICAVATILPACGGGSGGGSSVPPPPPPPPPAADTAAPAVSFSPDSLSVESGGAGSSTLTATDNVGVTSGPTVTCTNGGSFFGSTFTAPTVTVATTSVCTATASDAAGNSGTGTLTVTIPQPQNAPTASAVSNVTLVSEGQPFSLDASGSTDADGDALTYSWRQISGTPVTFIDATIAIVDLTAPILANDETLTFEVSVSDSINTSVAEVSVIVDDVQAVSLDAKASPFFSSGFPAPLIGLTPSGSDGYIAHWGDGGGSASYSTSSQEFSFDGEEVGEQFNGEFTAQGAQLSGSIRYVLQSGNEIAYVNRTNGYAAHRGRVQGTVSGFGSTFYADLNNSGLASRDVASIGDNQLVFVANTTSASDDYAIRAAIVQADGTSIITEISPESNKAKSNLTVEAYNQAEYAVLWWEHNADVTGTDIYMQRATTGGVLLGGKTQISTGLSNLGPEAVVLSDGNLLVTWNNIVSNVFTTKGKILRPDGTTLINEFEINRPAATGGKDTRLIALNTGGFFIVSNPRNSMGDRDIIGQAFGDLGNALGDKFIFAEGLDQNRNILADRAVLSGDNKAIIGWQAYVASEGIDRNFSASFYPVGRE